MQLSVPLQEAHYQINKQQDYAPLLGHSQLLLIAGLLHLIQLMFFQRQEPLLQNKYSSHHYLCYD